MSEKSKIRQAVRRLRVVYGEGDAYVTEVLSRSNGRTVACKSGCAHCCRLLPLVTMSEALAIAMRLTEDPTTNWAVTASKIDKQVDVIMNQSPSGTAWFRMQIPCALLKDEACSVYSDRPSACRMLFAMDSADNCAMAPDGQARQVARPDLRVVERMVGQNAMALCNTLGITWAPAPMPIALQWAFLALREGPEALRRKLKGTPFADEATAIAYWSNMLRTPDDEPVSEPA